MAKTAKFEKVGKKGKTGPFIGTQSKEYEQVSASQSGKKSGSGIPGKC